MDHIVDLAARLNDSMDSVGLERGSLYLRWQILLAGTVVLIIAYFVVVFVYRLTLHPLAKYPGPFFARISDWPLVYHCYKGDRHIWELQNHDRYGSIVRYGANSISLSSVEALQAIHGTKANVKKGSWYKTLDISAGAPSLQMVIHKQPHALRRRVMAPAFSERALREAEHLITVHAQKYADGLASDAADGWSAPKSASDWSTYFGFDFVSDLGYGKSFGMLADENRWVPGVLEGASQFLYYLGYLPFIELVRPLLGTCVQDYIGGQEAADSLRYTQLANSRVAERMKLEEDLKASGKESSRKDTFHYLLNSKDPVTGRTFSLEELQADSALIIAAGSDGVGLTLAAVLFYLITNPAALERLTAEIRAAFSDSSDILNPTLGSLPFLQACLDETMRLCPPKASTLPREVLAGGLTIGEEHIPQGITVGVPLYVLHHDEDIYGDPWTFRPERWIVDEKTGVTEADVAAARSAYSPFLIGPMNCIGKNLTYIALKQALARLLWQNDIRQAGDLTGGGRPDFEEGRRRIDEYQMKDLILGFRDGPMIQVRSRL